MRQDREQHRPFQHRNSNRLATRSGPPSSSFTVDLKVRDSELDQFLVVNNANYSVYLQHARHEFLEKIGLPVAAATEEGGALALSRLVLKMKKRGMSWTGKTIRFKPGFWEKFVP